MKGMIQAVLLLALSLGGCASTKIKEEWRDPGYQGRPAASVLVVALPAGTELARECQEEFLAQLKGTGVRAVAGQSGTARSPSSQVATAQAREQGLEMVLVARFLEQRSELTVYPRETGSGTLLLGTYDLWSDSPNLRENRFDSFGTALYQASTDKVVWTAMSETFLAGSQRKVLKSYVKAMLEKMRQQGLLQGRQPN